MEFDTEEVTQPLAHQTLEELAAEWRAQQELEVIVRSERPTRNIRRPVRP